MYYKDGKSANVQKEKYEKHRNVLVFFFTFAMLVIPNFQKLSLGTRSIVLGIFLSKPQAWNIITARSVVYIISPCGAVYHHAPACILLRLDDIQHFVLMIYRNKLRMIYTPSA